MIRTLAVSTATILALGACATAPATVESIPEPQAQPAATAAPVTTPATTATFDPIGSYTFSVRMENQTIGGTMNVRKGQDGKLGGEMASDQGTLTFNWLTVEGRRMTGGGVLDNSPELVFVFDFVGDDFTGTLSAQGQQIGTLTGSRKKS